MIKSGAYGEAKVAMRTHIERTLEVLVPQIPNRRSSPARIAETVVEADLRAAVCPG